MATRTDVAKLAGVSVATVSNVFIGRKPVSAELTEKVKKSCGKVELFAELYCTLSFFGAVAHYRNRDYRLCKSVSYGNHPRY